MKTRRNSMVSVLAALLSVFFTAACSAEKSDWQKTQAKDETSAYEGFIKKYPGSKFVEQAKQDLRRLSGQIVFASSRDGNNEIYVMNPDGTDVVRLTEDSADDSDPSWSPDNQQIAFVSDRTGNREIYVMKADGRDVTRLTDHPALDSVPAWSRDGRHIAFVSDRDGNNEIYIMNADGTNQRNLTKNPALDISPAWSPDGQQIAFASYRYDSLEICAVNIDGSNFRRLTNTPDFDWGPSWSPDGQRIAFVSGSTGSAEKGTSIRKVYFTIANMFLSGDDITSIFLSVEKICVMNADGSDMKPLTANTLFSIREPVWSPDGRRIAVVSDMDKDNNHEIYVMNSDGTNLMNISKSPKGDYCPDW